MFPGVENVLEYDKIKRLLKKYTASQLGAACVDALAPSDELDTVRKLLKLCSETKTFHQLYNGIPLKGLKDIRGSLTHAAKSGSILDVDELLDVAKIAQIPTDIHKAFSKCNQSEFPHLFSIVGALPRFPELAKTILDCIGLDGVLLDRASTELRAIRRKLSRLRENIHQKLETTLRSAEYQKSIQESVITSRNNRYVLPIKQEARSSFPGVVQGQSTSGATFFIEPLAIVEMNNALHETVEAEHREIRRILLSLTDEVRVHLHELELALMLLAELDFLTAKARLSLALDGVEPRLNTRGVVELFAARHPVLEYHLRETVARADNKTDANVPERIVPTDVHIGKSFKTLVITGPNTGGKTVVLKTVGLLALMAQSGLHIPAAAGSQLAIFKQIFADIGDEQGIEQNLSTFSSHITKIAEMLKRLPDDKECHSLVLLDEIGAGTDPSEGTALSMALLDWLSKKRVKTIVTTHYGALKAYAHTQADMENASMEFDSTTLRPTYRLQVGVPGSSNAIKIAEQLGIPGEVLKAAQKHLGNNRVAVEDLLVELQKTERELEIERLNLQDKIRVAEAAAQKHKTVVQNLETERRSLIQRAENEALETVSDARRTVETLIADIRREKASKASIQSAFSKIGAAKKQLRPKKSPKKPQNLVQPKVAVGDKVRVKKLNRFGEVNAIGQHSKAPLQISVGNMQMQIGYEDIDYIEPKKRHANLSTSVLDIQYSKADTIQTELNVRGMVVTEAWAATDKYLDDAYLSGLPSVRILHGKGTGALRKAIHQELAEHPHVTKYQLAPHSQGGEGVTIVTFKE